MWNWGEKENRRCNSNSKHVCPLRWNGSEFWPETRSPLDHWGHFPKAEVLRQKQIVKFWWLLKKKRKRHDFPSCWVFVKKKNRIHPNLYITFRYPAYAQRHLNPLTQSMCCCEKHQSALRDSNSDSNESFLQFQYLSVCAPAWPHLKYVHLLHFSQSRSLEQDSRTRWCSWPRLWHGQVNARSGFDITRTSLSQAGQGAKCWGKRKQQQSRKK